MNIENRNLKLENDNVSIVVPDWIRDPGFFQTGSRVKPGMTSNSGFSLVGVLIASFILTTGILAVSQLLGSTEKFTGLGRESFVAVNSAREGIELVRAMRDTNWFTSDDRSQWLDKGICSSSGTIFSENNRQFTLDSAMVRNQQTIGTGDGKLYEDSSNHEWTHTVSDRPTPFSRLITIDCSTATSDPAKVIVESKVTWQSRGQNREVVIKEAFYNWLPSQRKINP